MTKQLDLITKILTERRELDELSTGTLKSYAAKGQKRIADIKAKGFKKTSAEAGEMLHLDKNVAKAKSKIAASTHATKSEPVKPQHDKAALHSQLKDLKGQFDPSYQHSDDHSVYTKHRDIHAKITDIEKKLRESEELDELSKDTLGSYIGKADREVSDLRKKSDRSKNLQRAYDLLGQAQKRRAGSNKAVAKLSRKMAGERWGVTEAEELDELSKDTLRSYVRKATDDTHSREDKIQGIYKKADAAEKSGDKKKAAALDSDADKLHDKNDQRNRGKFRANHKIVNQKTKSGSDTFKGFPGYDNGYYPTKKVTKESEEIASDLEEAVVVHSSKEKDGKEYQVLSRKNNREFVIQSKKKDGSWHTHDAVGTEQRARQLIVTGRYSNVSEAVEVQTVTITVPALIRLCEIAREEVDGDTELHEYIESLIEASNGTIDSQMIDDVLGESVNESFTVVDHNKKQVHVAYSENAAKKKAEELSKATGKQHTVQFKREAVVKEGEIVSADRKMGKDGRLYPAHRSQLGTTQIK